MEFSSHKLEQLLIFQEGIANLENQKTVILFLIKKQNFQN